jgi:DNA-directed RNA polymerase specialized sigma24 family protein
MVEVICGDVDSLALLFRRHGGPLLAFVRGLILDLQKAEEIVQDAFLKIWLESPRQRFWH